MTKKLYVLIIILMPVLTFAQDSLKYTNTEIIYGRKDGMALTMLKLSPTGKSNGKAIISVLSGNWISAYRQVENATKYAILYIDRGYTVFLVMHGSQPRYTIPEEVADIKRAVRFVRYHSKDYGIDPDHIGITGASSGGHLSLMVATTDDVKDAASKDPVDQVSSRVQAVAIFFPPTDFLHFGQANFTAANSKAMLATAGVAAAFDFKTWDMSSKTYIPVSDSVKMDIVKQMSPIYSVTSDDPPIFIVHGDADFVVPIQQSKAIIEKFKAAKVPNEFIILPGRGHGWLDSTPERTKFADWFDKYLK